MIERRDPTLSLPSSRVFEDFESLLWGRQINPVIEETIANKGVCQFYQPNHLGILSMSEDLKEEFEGLLKDDGDSPSSTTGERIFPSSISRLNQGSRLDNKDSWDAFFESVSPTTSLKSGLKSSSSEKGSGEKGSPPKQQFEDRKPNSLLKTAGADNLWPLSSTSPRIPRPEYKHEDDHASISRAFDTFGHNSGDFSMVGDLSSPQPNLTDPLPEISLQPATKLWNNSTQLHQDQELEQQQPTIIEATDAAAPAPETVGSIASKFQPASKSSLVGGILPEDFQPLPYSVIVGKGKESKNVVGNRRLSVLASVYLEKYANADNDRDTKSEIVSTLIATVQNACPVGGFIRLGKNQRWYEVSKQVAREKVGYTLRELLGDKYKSSSKAKASKRKSAKKERRKSQEKAQHHSSNK